MNQVKPVISHAQSASIVQPPQSALDGPALFSQTAAMRGAALGEFGSDTPPFQLIAVWLRVVAPVAQQLFRTTAWATSFSLHTRHGIEQRKKLGDVVGVSSRDADGQWHAPGIYHQVVFGSGAGTVGGVWADGLAFLSLLEELEDTPTARTEDESTAARDQSKAPACCNLHSKSVCNDSHTPAPCHAFKRRQQLMPDPHPISCGKYSHGNPVLRINKIPVNVARLSKRGLPPLGLAGSGGKRGEINNHNSSSKSGFAMQNSLLKRFC